MNSYKRGAVSASAFLSFILMAAAGPSRCGETPAAADALALWPEEKKIFSGCELDMAQESRISLAKARLCRRASSGAMRKMRLLKNPREQARALALESRIAALLSAEKALASAKDCAALRRNLVMLWDDSKADAELNAMRIGDGYLENFSEWVVKNRLADRTAIAKALYAWDTLPQTVRVQLSSDYGEEWKQLSFAERKSALDMECAGLRSAILSAAPSGREELDRLRDWLNGMKELLDPKEFKMLSQKLSDASVKQSSSRTERAAARRAF